MAELKQGDEVFIPARVQQVLNTGSVGLQLRDGQYLHTSARNLLELGEKAQDGAPENKVLLSAPETKVIEPSEKKKRR